VRFILGVMDDCNAFARTRTTRMTACAYVHIYIIFFLPSEAPARPRFPSPREVPAVRPLRRRARAYARRYFSSSNFVSFSPSRFAFEIFVDTPADEDDVSETFSGQPIITRSANDSQERIHTRTGLSTYNRRVLLCRTRSHRIIRAAREKRASARVGLFVVIVFNSKGRQTSSKSDSTRFSQRVCSFTNSGEEKISPYRSVLNL